MKKQAWLRTAGLASAAAALTLTVTPIGEGFPLDGVTHAEAASPTYQTTENLNLRTGASAEHDAAAIIPKGKHVQVLSKSGSWYEVRYGSKTGYVNSAFLKKAGKPEPVLETYAAVENLNLREGAGMEYGIITEIPKGEKVTYLSKNGKWFKVSYGIHTGYVNAGFLTDDPVKDMKNYPAPSTDTPGTYIDGILIVNKENALPSNYNPGVIPEAEQAVVDMTADAKKQGVEIRTVSAFRSFSYQTGLYDNYVTQYGYAKADTISAKAGHSEHQAGLAFDFAGSSNRGLSTSFAETEEGKWLAANAHKYGFILRYPKGKEHITGYQFEPWHFRYLGTEQAGKVKNSGKTLEEFLNINLK
ncbi:D-alanyl-D-alanine carboxypeptidase family protein [Planococcus shenhongbingii]|uniref:D-alanyl-D-alanine carboxypeptidase family protein n=1 Tax=Planococcus shenhongbingii TaxID=3058398 RepID=A0ABT8N9N6_9BACL|nr:D-alanyl-D-alanine carboxypeptidase family protein [Planococcus sp. N017]MDN7244604.1 D-alanyl-D-alanine carboxypeptidase family protein [Planococcus sp. N017]